MASRDSELAIFDSSARNGHWLIACCSVALLAAVGADASAGMFVSPIGGVAYQDWSIVNYVDLTSGNGISDYRSGKYTYDGHNAIDFTLPNFAAMDAGVSVNAAADGIVVTIRDGEYDRWSRVNPNPGDPANRIVISHGNGITTQYLHLKNGSINVKPGDTVTAGQKIGEVGSSGNSTDPHLHFAVRENGVIVETYLDPDRWWIDPLPYSGDVAGALDHGVVKSFPTTAELVDRPMDDDLFYQSDGAGQVALVWANLHGFNSGDDIDVYFFRPDGTEYSHSQYTTGQIRYGWKTYGTMLPALPDLGEWMIDYQRNGSTIFTDSFRVVVPEASSWMLTVFVGMGFGLGVRGKKA